MFTLPWLDQSYFLQLSSLALLCSFTFLFSNTHLTNVLCYILSAKITGVPSTAMTGPCLCGHHVQQVTVNIY
jgi:hypothetical protein